MMWARLLISDPFNPAGLARRRRLFTYQAGECGEWSVYEILVAFVCLHGAGGRGGNTRMRFMTMIWVLLFFLSYFTVNSHD